MKIKKTKITEAFLDPEEQFYDYGTKEISGNNYFDTSKSELSYYTSMIRNPEYTKNNKNLDAKIVEMSPKEYFEGTANIFNSSPEKQIEYTALDKNTYQHLDDVINKYNKTFPITVLNFAERSQEGRHRMYYLGDKFGWDKKYPVLVVTWADEELHQQMEKQKELEKKQRKLDKAIEDSLQYNYYSIEDLKSQLIFTLERQFEYEDEKPQPNFTETSNSLIVDLGRGVISEINKEDIQMKDIEVDDEDVYGDLDLDDPETIDFFKRYDLDIDKYREEHKK